MLNFSSVRPMQVTLAAAALALFGASAVGADAQWEQGRALFTGTAVPACAICHTLKDAGATGEIGPVLDDLKPDATRVEKALRGGLGVMPSYQDTLTDAQIKQLAAYVSTVTGGGK